MKLRASSSLLLRLLYAAVLAASIPLLAWNGVTQQLNAALGDWLMQWRAPSSSGAVRRIILLAIDDRTLAAHGPLPLNRATLARALERVAGFSPRILVIDFLLSEPAQPEADAALARALGRFPKVVLAAALEAGNPDAPRWIEPLPLFRHSSSTVGHVHAAPDNDLIVRSVLLAKVGAGRRYWSVGLEAARLAAGGERPVETPDAVRLSDVRIPAAERDERLMRINFAGPEVTFETVSLTAVLDGAARAEAFRDRIVIVGVTAQGGGDRQMTPVSSQIGMSGIEIHANIIRTILDGMFLRPLSLAGELLAYLLIGTACVTAVRITRGARLVLLLATVAAAVPALGVAALQAGSLWPLGSLFAVFVLSAAVAGAGEYGLVTRALRAEERKRKEYAFRVQAIAHEIKTPLTAIQGSSELISQDLIPEQKRMEMAGLIYKESRRLTSLVQTFLDVERMAAGALEIRKQPVDLQALCAEVLDRGRLYAARKQIRVEAEVPPLALAADPDLLSFAIYNLLTNAVKYSPKGSAIRLTAWEERGTASISVADQGFGIAPEEQQKIFEKFYRMSRDEKGAEPGSGIGLALVKEIVVQHGGRIAVESRPGAGSRFTIVLPKE